MTLDAHEDCMDTDDEMLEIMQCPIRLEEALFEEELESNPAILEEIDVPTIVDNFIDLE